MYSSLYDDKHRFYEISTTTPKGGKPHQKGVREQLLCEECEQKLSLYERYASLILNGGYTLEVRNKGRLVHLKGIEYCKFKLFALSVLWRAGISNLKVFEQVELGPHEEVLRRMIISGDPGAENMYPFTCCHIIMWCKKR